MEAAAASTAGCGSTSTPTARGVAATSANTSGMGRAQHGSAIRICRIIGHRWDFVPHGRWCSRCESVEIRAPRVLPESYPICKPKVPYASVSPKTRMHPLDRARDRAASATATGRIEVCAWDMTPVSEFEDGKCPNCFKLVVKWCGCGRDCECGPGKAPCAACKHPEVFGGRNG